jgi:hypothetical protein
MSSALLRLSQSSLVSHNSIFNLALSQLAWVIVDTEFHICKLPHHLLDVHKSEDHVVKGENEGASNVTALELVVPIVGFGAVSVDARNSQFVQLVFNSSLVDHILELITIVVSSHVSLRVNTSVVAVLLVFTILIYVSSADVSIYSLLGSVIPHIVILSVTSSFQLVLSRLLLNSPYIRGVVVFVFAIYSLSDHVSKYQALYHIATLSSHVAVNSELSQIAVFLE